MSAANELWRDTVPGPKRLARQIEDAFKKGRNVVLTHTFPLPWADDMDEKLQKMLPQVQFRSFSCPAVQIEDAVFTLLQMVSPKLAMRCPSGFRNEMVFLAQEGVFANTVVRLDARNCPDPAPWIRLAWEYRGGGLENGGVMFLDIPADVPVPKASTKTDTLDTSDAVSFDNLRLYASLLAEEESRIPKYLKTYAACAAANLCGGSAEFIPGILHSTDFLAEHPHDAIRRLWEEDGCPSDPNPKGPYALLTAGREGTLEHLIWKSQTQVLFSEIEEERLSFTRKYAVEINEALLTAFKDKNGKRKFVTDLEGNPIESADSAELNTLVFMTKAHRYDDENRLLLYIPDHSDYQRLIFLRDRRNELAHRKPCEPDKVREMLERR